MVFWHHYLLGIFYIFLFAEIVRRKAPAGLCYLFLVLFCLIIIHNGLKISIQPLILMLVVATPSYLVIQKELTDPLQKDWPDMQGKKFYRYTGYLYPGTKNLKKFLRMICTGCLPKIILPVSSIHITQTSCSN